MAPITTKKSPSSNGTPHIGNKITRRKLQTLQVSANDGSLLVGGQRSGLKSLHKKFPILHDLEMKKSQENETPIIDSAGMAEKLHRKSQAADPNISLSVLDENCKQEASATKQDASLTIKLTKKSQRRYKSPAKTSLKRSKELQQQFSIVEPERKSHPDFVKAANAIPKNAKLPEIILSNVPSVEVSKNSSSPIQSPSSTLDMSPSPVPLEEPEISDVLRYMTTESEPSESYWKDLAEQLQGPLVKTLFENQRLHDEIKVLKVENSDLVSIVEEATELAVHIHNLARNEDGDQ